MPDTGTEITRPDGNQTISSVRPVLSEADFASALLPPGRDLKILSPAENAAVLKELDSRLEEIEIKSDSTGALRVGPFGLTYAAWQDGASGTSIKVSLMPVESEDPKIVSWAGISVRAVSREGKEKSASIPLEADGSAVLTGLSPGTYSLELCAGYSPKEQRALARQIAERLSGYEFECSQERMGGACRDCPEAYISIIHAHPQDGYFALKVQISPHYTTLMEAGWEPLQLLPPDWQNFVNISVVPVLQDRTDTQEAVQSSSLQSFTPLNGEARFTLPYGKYRLAVSALPEAGEALS